MQGSDYIFFIVDENNLFYRLDDHGLLVSSANPYPLQFSPTGWDEIAIQNLRNKKYWGVDRSVSVPLSYVEDGAGIIKSILYKYGIEKPCYLVICRQELNFTPVPAGSISFTEGGSPMPPNQHTRGTITGTPGETVYIRLDMVGAQAGDDVIGNLDGYFIHQVEASADIVHQLTIPASGQISINLYFRSVSGLCNPTFEVCAADGSSTGSYGYWYRLIYKGDIDLSTFNHAGAKVTCNTLEDGLPKFLKANEATVYELPFDVPEAINVKMDGILLHEKLVYDSIPDMPLALNQYGVSLFEPLSKVANEGESVGVLYESPSAKTSVGMSWSQKLEDLNILLQNAGTANLDLNLSGKVEFKCTAMNSSPAYAVRIRFIKSKQALSDQNAYAIIATTDMVVGTTYSADFDLNITLEPDERLYREIVFFGAAGSNAEITFTPSSRTYIAFKTRRETTYIKALPGQYIFDQLVDRITESTYAADASAYLAALNWIVFTSGNAIRGLADAKMQISLNQFFEFFDNYSAVSLGEQSGKVTLRTKVDSVDTSQSIALGPVSNFKVGIATDYLFNELEIGYPEIKNDVGALNGNEEFNCKYLFSLGTMRKPNKLNKVSKIKASCYEIEKIRVTTYEKKTTDNKSDNDVFALAINTTLVPASGSIPVHYTLDRSLNSTATGLLEPDTVFNIRLSPKRMLINNGPYLRSCLYKCDTRLLKFISADRNTKLVAGGIVEKDDLVIGDAGNSFFIPVYFDFDVPAPDDLLQLLDLNPLQVFTFEIDGNTYSGILNKVSIAPSTRKAQSYQLLSTPTNDLTKLIQYYG